MNRIQQQVLEFHRVYEVPTRDVPGFPDIDRIKLRAELIREEFEDELVPAMNSGTIVDVADALGDLLYVIFGTALEFGLDMEPIVNEIQRSNLSKLGADGKPVRRDDGKIMKGPNFSPPNLTPILDAQGRNPSVLGEFICNACWTGACEDCYDRPRCTCTHTSGLIR